MAGGLLTKVSAKRNHFPHREVYAIFCGQLTNPSAAVTTATYDSTIATSNGTLKDLCLKAYHHMVRARVLEEKLASLYRSGRVVGGVYLGKGQEAFSASMTVHLTKGKDVYAPLIRDQAGRMTLGESIFDCTRTYLGSLLGPMRGRDGNIHRGRPKEGILAMISHLGSVMGVVNGVLLSRRLQGRLGDCVGATVIGDGGTSTGAFHEALNMAAIEKLPVVVAVANNNYSYSTPNDRSFACNSLVDRAVGYGVEGYTVNGTDLVECVSIFQNAVARARAGHGPQMVVGSLLRLSGHGEHDDASYIPEEMRKSELGKDCMHVAETRLLENGWITKDEVASLYEKAREESDDAISKTSTEPLPDPYKENWCALSSPLQTEE